MVSQGGGSARVLVDLDLGPGTLDLVAQGTSVGWVCAGGQAGRHRLSRISRHAGACRLLLLLGRAALHGTEMRWSKLSLVDRAVAFRRSVCV